MTSFKSLPGIQFLPEPNTPLQLALVTLAFSNITNLSEREQWRLGVESSVDIARITKYLRERWVGENRCR